MPNPVSCLADKWAVGKLLGQRVDVGLRLLFAARTGFGHGTSCQRLAGLFAVGTQFEIEVHRLGGRPVQVQCRLMLFFIVQARLKAGIGLGLQAGSLHDERIDEF